MKYLVTYYLVCALIAPIYFYFKYNSMIEDKSNPVRNLMEAVGRNFMCAGSALAGFFIVPVIICTEILELYIKIRFRK